MYSTVEIVFIVIGAVLFGVLLVVGFVYACRYFSTNNNKKAATSISGGGVPLVRSKIFHTVPREGGGGGRV